MIRRGDKEVTAVYRGATPIVAVYRGEKVVWQKNVAKIEFSGTAVKSSIYGMSFKPNINGENVAIPINADGTFSYSQNGVLTRVNSMFQSCDNIITLDISNLDLSNVSNVAFMFASCSKLQKLYMCDIDTGKIGNMNDLMFSGCNALNHIRCRRTFRDWCWANQDDIMLPTAMRSGGSGTWELVD